MILISNIGLWEAQKTVVAALTASTTYSGLVQGTYDEPPTNQNYDYVVIGQPTEISDNTLTRIGFENTFTLSIYTKPAKLGWYTAYQIMDAMNEVLNVKRLSMSNLDNLFCKQDNVIQEKQEDKRILHVRYRLWSQQKNTTYLLLNSVQSPIVAYALDKIISTYTGNVVRVRRSSDDTEQDIGFVNNDIDLSSLLIFANEGDAYVVTVYDQSGNQINATQSDTTKQPKIVDKGVYVEILFENVTPKAFLDAGKVFNNISIFSMYANLKNQTSNTGRIIDKNVKLWWLSNTNDVSLWQEGGSTGFWVSDESLNNDQEYNLITTFDGVTGNKPKMYISKDSELTVNQNSGFTSPITDDSDDNLYIGNRLAGDRAFIGKLRRLVLYNRVLTDLERTAIYNNPYVKKTNGTKATVLLVFDDGGKSVYQKAYPYLQGKNIKITTAPVKNWIGTSGEYNGARDFMNLQELKDFYYAGHDVISHTETHTDFTTLTESEIEDEINNMKDYLNNNGMSRGADYLIVPFNKTSDDYFNAVANTTVKMARAGDIKCLNPEIENWYKVGYLYSPGLSSTVETMEAMIDEIIERNITCTIMLHYIEDSPSENVEISTTAFQGLIDYLVEKEDDVRTMTFSEWYNEQYS